MFKALLPMNKVVLSKRGWSSLPMMNIIYKLSRHPDVRWADG